jgi:hypothetical protein
VAARLSACLASRLSACLVLLLVACGGGAGPTPPTDPAAGVPASLTKMAGDDQHMTVASAVPVQPLVVLRDAGGRAVPGMQVTFAVASGGGWVTVPTATTDAAGMVTTAWYLGPQAGSEQRLRASAAGFTADFTATATALVAGTVYFGANQYVELIAGSLPVIVSAPHGGALRPEQIPDRAPGPEVVLVADANTEELARDVADAFRDVTGGAAPTVIIMRLHRTKVDANREITVAAQGNPHAERAWREFQGYIEAARAALVDAGRPGFFLDLHGHGHDIQRLELGYMLSASDLAQSDAALNSTTLVQKSSMRAFVATSGTPHAEVIRGSTSLGTLFEERGYPSVPSTAQPHPAGAPYFSGGYNTGRHASRDGDLISGVQLEANRIGVRDTQANRRRFADALVDAIRAWRPALLE